MVEMGVTEKSEMSRPAREREAEAEGLGKEGGDPVAVTSSVAVMPVLLAATEMEGRAKENALEPGSNAEVVTGTIARLL